MEEVFTLSLNPIGGSVFELLVTRKYTRKFVKPETTNKYMI